MGFLEEIRQCTIFRDGSFKMKMDFLEEIRHVRLFADDCIIYRVIKRNVDAELLQDDINTLQEWGNEWKMAFHPEKCEQLRITKKHSPIDATYKLQDHVLRKLDSKKDHGVTIYKNVCWNDHVQYIYTKANNTLSLLRRNMGAALAVSKKHATNHS